MPRPVPATRWRAASSRNSCRDGARPRVGCLTRFASNKPNKAQGALQDHAAVHICFRALTRRNAQNTRMSDSEWEARYESGDMPWEKGEPSPGLVDFLAAHAELPRGTVCVPGCGTGHDVRAWARAGFEAFGFDLAPSAISLSIEKTKAAGLSAQYRVADFLRDEPPRRFDWLFAHTP